MVDDEFLAEYTSVVIREPVGAAQRRWGAQNPEKVTATHRNVAAVKSEQLGINISTAQSKLRRNILFHLAVKCEMDVCCRCEYKILSADDFTIEHKKAWLHNDPNLFWDMDNIAFSHKKCNVRGL